ncbi:hypothetical protein GCM10010191_51040 [Actinomadura vinacea]|uniref:Uncharacterized protein n=1 Tax=Actinomadura vinacea TaxID=115336 RepID=A0ABN3JI67_9ACTN
MALRVGITDAAARQAAAGLGGTPVQARAFLEKQVRGAAGRVVTSDQLPAPHKGKRSKSDRFLLIDGMLILPLAMDRRDPGGFTATACVFLDAYLRANGRGKGHIDPLTLTGAELMEQVRLTEHAVIRYRQRAGGPHAGRDQMRQVLGRDARAVRRRPRWTNSSNTADFFLLAGGIDGEEEFCLPISRQGGSGKPLVAMTCLHRSMPLFELSSAELAGRVAFTKDVMEAFDRLFPGEGTAAARFTRVIALHGRLEWRPPRGHTGHQGARFYVVAGQVFIPVAWKKNSKVPLLALGVESIRLPLLKRLTAWLRRRFSPRVTAPPRSR